MRGTGVDSFDDFEVIVSVHDVIHQDKGNIVTSVRVSAGSFFVETDPSSSSIFQQSFPLFVEQGTDYILVELLDGSQRKMAALKLDPIKEVLRQKDGSQKTYTMKTQNRAVGSVKVSLTMKVMQPGDNEKGLMKQLDGKPLSNEVNYQVQEQLKLVGWKEKVKPADQLHKLASACTGPVERFSTFGVANRGKLAVVGPPTRRRWHLGFWTDPTDFGEPGVLEVDLMHILSVQEDPNRSEFFVVSYMDQDRVDSRSLFRRIDRPRDVWVHLLMMHISAVRESKEQTKRSSEKPKDRSGDRTTSVRSASAQKSQRLQGTMTGSASQRMTRSASRGRSVRSPGNAGSRQGR